MQMASKLDRANLHCMYHANGRYASWLTSTEHAHCTDDQHSQKQVMIVMLEEQNFWNLHSGQIFSFTCGMRCRIAKRTLDRPDHCMRAVSGEPRTRPAGQIFHNLVSHASKIVHYLFCFLQTLRLTCCCMQDLQGG